MPEASLLERHVGAFSGEITDLSPERVWMVWITVILCMLHSKGISTRAIFGEAALAMQLSLD